MKTRIGTEQAGTNNFPWHSNSVAPSLAITPDWWNQSARLEALTSERAFPESPQASAELNQASTEPRPRNFCPTCGAIIYSRRHPLCGVCAQPLPPEARFSESEAMRLQLVVNIERERHRRWMVRNS